MRDSIYTTKQSMVASPWIKVDKKPIYDVTHTTIQANNLPKGMQTQTSDFSKVGRDRESDNALSLLSKGTDYRSSII